MKQIWLGLVVVLVSVVTPGFAQQEKPGEPQLLFPEPAAAAPYGAPESQLLFPHNWIRGHVDFEVAPSHNEPDLARCSQLPAAQFGGASSPCTAYARWVLSGYLEIQPIGRTLLRHVFLYFTPQFFFGRNVPQYLYTASFEPMMDERSIGLGVELPKHLELRLTSHRVDWLGRYRGNLGPADLGTVGSYGNYTTVAVRWNFGGWGRSHE